MSLVWLLSGWACGPTLVFGNNGDQRVPEAGSILYYCIVLYCCNNGDQRAPIPTCGLVEQSKHDAHAGAVHQAFKIKSKCAPELLPCTYVHSRKQEWGMLTVICLIAVICLSLLYA
ncbi:hypothetical protein COO60DRAFT_1035199 [Scenedesmus sp. NREL 46B-D3]|nr:hypothetical protein COO60DRAFT_1035199 [Scenedesmus sp. NREL 46B-D3]